jgi:hypothetical protein
MTDPPHGPGLAASPLDALQPPEMARRAGKVRR